MKDVARNFIVEVEWIEYEEKVDYVYIQAENFGAAAAKLEEYYGEVIVSFKITELESGNVVPLTKDNYDELLRGGLY